MRLPATLPLIPLAALASVSLGAQDRRQVREPKFPAVCVVLEARLGAPQGALPEAAERTPDTARLQEAIDRCVPGQAVKLTRAAADNAFLSGPIQLKRGVTLLIDASTTLFASRNPRDYDVDPGSCGILTATTARGRGCKPLVLAEDAPGAAVMGDGAIDGRGGFTLLGQDVTWWELAKQAKVMDLQQSCPRILVVRRSNGFTLYRTTLRNSPNFHVVVDRTDGFTAWGVRIRTPRTARNTDGIDPSASTNVTIAHSFIDTGDDNVAIKAGDAGPATHMTIAHNHFYSGHGMSIGSGTSGGVSAIRVNDLTIDGADNGLRIKSDRSRGGLVEDVSYEDVCLRNVTNPIVITTMYTNFSGDKLPVYRRILLKDVRSVTPGRMTFLGLDSAHQIEVTLDNVSAKGLRPADVKVEHAEVSIGPRRGSFAPSGNGVSVTDAGSTAGALVRCESRFVPFPDLAPPASAGKVPAEDPTLYVAADGTGDYYSIQGAIDVAPSQGALISVAPGIYRETVSVAKPNLHIRSPYTDARRTVIAFDKSAGTAGGTLRSATVEVRADGFLAENLTFANDWNATHPQLPQGSQAVALLVTGDRAVFRNVRILGNQDTLYAGNKNCEGPNGQPCSPARQYFEKCYVEGNVDFIFGDGKAFFEGCEIHSTAHEVGFITAQGKHYSDQDSAFVFNNCKLTAASGVTNVWLGRPWRDHASVIFLDTEMGPHIEPGGFREWHPGETNRLETVFFAERASAGPGSHIGRRDPHVKLLTAESAARYSAKRFLAGQDSWDPTARE